MLMHSCKAIAYMDACCCRCGRGHMWDSGYVVVPTANGCCLNITLQVDPKVGG
jgi:uncharacterized protein (DUF983 family)